MRRLPATRWLIAGAIGVACAIAAALIALSLSGGDDVAATPTSFRTEALRALEGIPQRGQVLGAADAPVALVEFADLQCPFCARYATETLPALVREYVRAGKLQLVFRPIAFIGPDSAAGVRAALAAGRQDRLWHMAELLYENQGAENAGWLTREFVIEAAEAVPGLDPERFESDLDSSAVTDLASVIGKQANALHVDETPFFLIGRTGGRFERLEVDSLEASAFRPAIDALLK